MTTPPPALPPDPIVSPSQVKAAPFYWPNLIAALIAAICVAIGSIGPWITFMGISRNNIGSGADGTITLILGIVAALALFALLNFGRTEVKSGRMVALGTVAGIAGVLAFITGFIDAQAVSSRKAEIFGTTIGPEIGWGLWMILIAGPVLAITSAIVVKQVKNIAKANAESAAPTQNFRVDLGSRSNIEPGTQAPAVKTPVPPASPTLPAPPPAVKEASVPPPPPPAAPKPVPPPAPPTPEPVPAPTVEIAHPPPPPVPPVAPPAPPIVPTPVVPPVPVSEAPATAAAFPIQPADAKGRSGLRRAAPWAGGVAALAAALAAGVWAGPYLTGGNKNTPEPAATSTTTPTTTTTKVTPSSTTPSSTAAAATSVSSAPATFGPFTSGDAKVLVAGQPREVRGDVSCFTYSGKLTISIGPIGNPVGATMSEADLRVNSVSLGTVNGVMLSVLDGAANSSATATKDGKSYRITGTASGIDVKNPLQPYTQPFEIDVTCP